LSSEAVPKLQLWNSNLRFNRKADFRPLFRKPVPRLTEFWNRLKYFLNISTKNFLRKNGT
jgi:hypothetical protein